MGRLFVKGMIVLLGLSLFWAAARPSYSASKAPVIFKEELRRMLDDPGVTIIDVRVEGAWKSSDRKIKGAVWEDPDRVNEWAGNYPKERAIVLYCS